MNLALSNFSWKNENHDIVFKELKKNNINKIETVLTKIDNWENLNEDVIKRYKEELISYGIEIYSMQSLFYNVKCYSFCDEDNMISHFDKLIKYSRILGVKVLVLGSPSLRLFCEDWKRKLVTVFKKIDAMLESSDIKLVIEPNSSIYNGRYFKTLGEIVFFLDLNEFNNIKTMIDTHNSILEDSDPIVELSHFFDYIEHIHVSEIKLKPLINLNFHDKFSKEIKKHNYTKTITFELGEYDNFSESIGVFSKIYG